MALAAVVADDHDAPFLPDLAFFALREIGRWNVYRIHDMARGEARRITNVHHRGAAIDHAHCFGDGHLETGAGPQPEFEGDDGDQH